MPPARAKGGLLKSLNRPHASVPKLFPKGPGNTHGLKQPDEAQLRRVIGQHLDIK